MRKSRYRIRSQRISGDGSMRRNKAEAIIRHPPVEFEKQISRFEIFSGVKSQLHPQEKTIWTWSEVTVARRWPSANVARMLSLVDWAIDCRRSISPEKNIAITERNVRELHVLPAGNLRSKARVDLVGGLTYLSLSKGTG